MPLKPFHDFPFSGLITKLVLHLKIYIYFFINICNLLVVNLVHKYIINGRRRSKLVEILEVSEKTRQENWIRKNKMKLSLSITLGKLI